MFIGFYLIQYLILQVIDVKITFINSLQIQTHFVVNVRMKFHIISIHEFLLEVLLLLSA